MVPEAAIEKINSKQEMHRLVRKIKKCDDTRFRYGHIKYTWDLELRLVRICGVV